MAGFHRLLACLGEAVCARGLKTLMECLPLGGAVFEIAENACQRAREGQLAALIHASAADVRAEADRVAADLAPPADRERLAAYLTQLPVTLRRAGRAPRPEDLLDLLPRCAPGDAAPGLPHWTLDALLGVGGSGEVWRARHAALPGLGPSAVKVFRDPAAARREADLVTRLDHPGVVPLLDASLADDAPCLRFEFVAGGDLTGRTGLSADAVLRGVAEVLAHAHSRGVVHRDLKPANVLLSGDRVRVTDFGIGAAGRSLTTTLRGAHTPLYASPEQARGDDPDPRDDVYSLGVIGYQLLAGDPEAVPSGLWADELRERGVEAGMIRLLGECVGRADRRPADGAALLARLTRRIVPEGRLQRFLDGASGALFGLLDLAGHPVGDEGLRALAASPRLAAVDALILSGCGVGDEGVKALAASPHAANLRRLVLWDNRIGDDGVKALVRLDSLTTLDLGRNRVGDEGVKALATMSSLTALILVSNRITDEGASALAASPHLAGLAELKPLDNRITAAGAAALKAAFGRRVRVM